MFCPKCGSILVPKKEGNKKVFACSCGYSTKEMEGTQIKETIKTIKQVDVVDESVEKTLPLTNAKCPKCGHEKAYFWLVQTRASDEPETKFLKCEKCKNIWRDYD